MKKNILNLFLLLAVVFSPVLASNQALAQSATGQNAIPCTVLKVPPVLKLGSTGPEVVKLQTALKALGYLNIPQSIPLGFLGFKTAAAVTQFQVDWNIVPFDGKVGKKTAVWLEKVTCGAASATNANLGNQNSNNTNTGNQQNQNQNNQNQNANNQNQNNQNQNNQNQNNQQQNNQNQQQNQQPGVTQNLTAPCAANTAAFVEVDSPNGGEIYNSTDKLEVKWSTCNLATPDTKMRVTLMHLNDVVMTADVLNTGSHIFVLTPALIMNPPVAPVVPIAFDKLFKVKVSAFAVNGAPSDMSDNTFAILDNGVNPNNPNPNANPGPIAPNVPQNPNQGWPLGCVWPLTVVNNLNGIPCVKPLPNPAAPNGPTTAADVCAQAPVPHVVLFQPNDGKFQIGSSTDVLWFNCNIPAGIDIKISLIQTTNAGITRYELNAQTPNDGIESVKLVALPGSPALVPGNDYQMMLDFVVTPAYTGPANPAWLHWGVDLSDGFITLFN